MFGVGWGSSGQSYWKWDTAPGIGWTPTSPRGSVSAVPLGLWVGASGKVSKHPATASAFRPSSGARGVGLEVRGFPYLRHLGYFVGKVR